MDRRQFVTALAVLPAAALAPAVLSPKERYSVDAARAFAEMMQRIDRGGDFDRELARFEYAAQLLRERHNVFLWDGPTTARGFRHPSWPAL